MSSVPSTLENTSVRRSIGLANSVARVTLRSAETVTFWAAILLPLAYLPLLAGGLAQAEMFQFVGLLACNLFALVAGHGYGRD
ncbi:hypothetical protein C499_05810 [Halogeometricum borinquense DSM 11551]|uniref:Uncharacterized protein n=2 Tax=Halogeometricum borinquense TaxID=60847 RepID=E4NLN8_HALBP|nr:hypothetical protein [Halogeometricum borinquense]ADQ67241.1 hypothetical protein Hbor_16730 [Halogeometricum borinquense DSM 11551]ELY29575.1 hypothetical protein C499_05810 [Halogeometricum borinquense DSM 11551]RYJ13806.1 hypothetical protein ELS19_07405 [Halogeometricum borinquense]